MLNTLALAIADTLTVLFIGDVMQHRNQLLSARIPDSDTTISSSYDYSSYFTHVRKFIDEADFTAANMEFCLGGAPYTGYPSFSAPESLAEEAADAGVDLFLCANNHICDKGRRGLASSLDKYSRIGVPVTGLYKDSVDEAGRNPFIADIRGTRVAFINFTYGTNGVRVPDPYMINMMDRAHVSGLISRAEDRGADIIIALPHWGREYVTAPDRIQREWAAFLLECGADAVIGTHPHVVQPVEFPVAYSLGNFVSNMSAVNTELGLMVAVKIAVTPEGQSSVAGFRVIPVWCSRPGGYCKAYTVLPVHEFLHREKDFLNKNNYKKMKDTYNRLKALFENE